MNKNLLLATFTLLFALVSLNVKAQDGSAANPYPISNLGALEALRNCMNSSGNFYYDATNHTFTKTQPGGAPAIAKNTSTHYKLLSDIDLNPDKNVAACDGNTDGLVEWVPFEKFYGQLDGNFHIISGVLINRPNMDQVGFFRELPENSSVKNLGIVNAYIAGHSKVGAMAGNMINAKITHCFVDAVITAYSAMSGGMVGEATNYSHIDSCYATGSLASHNVQVGGICGTGRRLEMKSCYSSLVINYFNLESAVGGVLGYDDPNATSTVTNSYYDKQMCRAVTSHGQSKLTSEMLQDTWTDLGESFAYNGSGCYPYLTGFSVLNAYVKLSTVPLLLNATQNQYMDTLTENFKLGGITDGVEWACTDTHERYAKLNGSHDSVQVIKEGWLQLIASLNGKTRTLALYTNKAPYIGTKDNPFPIDDNADLTIFRNGVNTNDKFIYDHFFVNARALDTWFWQANDIDLGDVDWKGTLRIGTNKTNAFGGVYDGGGHKLTNFTVTSDQYSGFFGYIKGGSVRNLGIQVAKFTPGNYSGTLCGQIVKTNVPGDNVTTTIDSCYCEPASSSVVLNLRLRSGGLIGSIIDSAIVTVSNCWNRCNIVVETPTTDLNQNIGGVVGYCYAFKSLNVTNCVNYGAIMGGVQCAGGVVGCVNSSLTKAIARIDHCTNIGDVGDPTSTYCVPITSEKWRFMVGGILGYRSSVKTIISYCYNSGNITSTARAAGIMPGEVDTVRHCVNTGNILVTDVSQPDLAGAAGISYSKVWSSLNTGDVTVERGGHAMGITNAAAFDCFNAGEVTAPAEWCAFAINGWGTDRGSAARNINIGRVNGLESYLGTTATAANNNHVDKQMVSEGHNQSSNIVKNTTEEMLGSSLPMGSNWVYTEGMYPRIKGIHNLPISIATAMPVVLSASSENTNSVKTDFTLSGCDSGVVWTNTGNMEILTPCVANKQTVRVVGTDAEGMNYFKATYTDENGRPQSKTVRVYRYVASPGTLTVDNIQDLRDLRDGVNTGAPFKYKGTTVPAGGLRTTFLQTADITMTTPTDNVWEAIGWVKARFRGVYNGDSHTISNLRQDSVLNCGLFGYSHQGKILNLNMDNVKITGVRGYAGAILAVGYRDTLTNCTASGSISGAHIPNNVISSYMGGLNGTSMIMRFNSSVNNCHVSGGAYVGGIAGKGSTSSEARNGIYSCANYGSVIGGSYVGGLVGFQLRIYNSYNAGEVTGSEEAIYVGGLSGKDTRVESSFNTGVVTARTSSKEAYVGGLVGWMTDNNNYRFILNSYNSGIVNGNNRRYVGGILGYAARSNSNSVEIKNNYVCNAVYGGENTGAILGFDYNGMATISQNYYDKTFCYVGGINNEDAENKAVGLTTTQMVGNALAGSLGAANFVYDTGDNYYPRVKNHPLDTMPASYASAAKLQLQDGELARSVSSDSFTVGGCVDSVVWGLKDAIDTTAIVFDNESCTASIQGLGVLYAKSSHSGKEYKIIKLNVGNSVLKPLEIVSEEELINFRDLINAGQEFYYDIPTQTFHADIGECTNPFPIANQGEDLYFKLTCEAVNLSDNGAWIPIGNTPERPFKGYLNGGKHTITGMKITANGDSQGFIGYLHKGSVDSLYFTNTQVSGTGSNKGVICGYSNEGVISECRNDNVTLTVSGTGSAWGGICGYSSAGTVRNCTTTGIEISGQGNSVTNVGGVVGYGNTGTVEGCTVNDLTFRSTAGTNNGGICGMAVKNSIVGCVVNNSSLTFNHSHGGGICGYDTSSAIIQCSFLNSNITVSTNNMNYFGGILGRGYHSSNTDYVYFTGCRTEGGSISAPKAFYVGGLFGQLIREKHVEVNGCSNHIPVEGMDYVGGIAGQLGGQMDSCYNTGSVKGRDDVGGLLGNTNTWSYAYKCYNTGDVEGSGKDVGGLIGRNPS